MAKRILELLQRFQRLSRRSVALLIRVYSKNDILFLLTAARDTHSSTWNIISHISESIAVVRSSQRAMCEL